MGIRSHGTSVEKDSFQKRENAIAREIVSEIINYGISQNQIIYIINDLALNLENPDHSKRIINAVRDIQEDKIIVATRSPLEVY